MQNKIRNISLFMLCFLTLYIKAQTDCKNAIYEADKLFEAGQIKECIDRLEPCTANIKDKEELAESYHLLAQAYQNLNNTDKANYYIKKMLQLKPDYQKYPNIDALDFSRLVNQYRVSPRLYLGLKFGFNINSVALKKSYSVYSSSQSYNPAAGYQFGLTADYRIFPDVSINTDLFLCGLKINHLIDSAGGARQNYNEQENYGMFNITAQKHIAVKKIIQVYAGIGFGIGYMYEANVNLRSTTLETQSFSQVSKNPIAERNKFQPCMIGIGGIGFPLSKGILNLDANYSYFLKNTVNASKRMSDLNFIFNNQYVNDDISLRLILINVSYKFPLLWSIELKK